MPTSLSFVISSRDEGFLISQSRSTVFFPAIAKDIARFVATVVLPSPGMELATSIT